MRYWPVESGSAIHSFLKPNFRDVLPTRQSKKKMNVLLRYIFGLKGGISTNAKGASRLDFDFYRLSGALGMRHRDFLERPSYSAILHILLTKLDTLIPKWSCVFQCVPPFLGGTIGGARVQNLYQEIRKTHRCIRQCRQSARKVSRRQGNRPVSSREAEWQSVLGPASDNSW